MKGVGGELDPGELLISDDNAHGILTAIELGPHPESSGRFRGPDQAHDGHQAHQRLPAPVHRDVREQAVFDLVPLAGPRREVTDGNGEPSAVRELLPASRPSPPLACACLPVAGSAPGRAPRARRTPPLGSRVLIVDREIPVARSTRAIPPWPSAVASDAAHNRFERSVNNARYFVRSVLISTDSERTSELPSY